MNNVWKRKNWIVVSLALLTIVSSNSAWANAEDKIKSGIDSAADTLKKGVDKAGDKIEDIQKYFDSYNWKGVFERTAVSGPTTVKNIHLNGHHRAIVVKPGERIEGMMKCKLDKQQTKDLRYHRILIGFKGLGPQTSIGQGVGYLAGNESKEEFVLIAPAKPGFYEIRFNPVEGYTEHEAMKKWTDDKGHEPDGTTTIGLVYVKA